MFTIFIISKIYRHEGEKKTVLEIRIWPKFQATEECQYRFKVAVTLVHSCLKLPLSPRFWKFGVFAAQVKGAQGPVGLLPVTPTPHWHPQELMLTGGTTSTCSHILGLESLAAPALGPSPLLPEGLCLHLLRGSQRAALLHRSQRHPPTRLLGGGGWMGGETIHEGEAELTGTIFGAQEHGRGVRGQLNVTEVDSVEVAWLKPGNWTQPARKTYVYTEESQGPQTFRSIIHWGMLIHHTQGFTKVFLILDTAVRI